MSALDEEDNQLLQLEKMQEPGDALSMLASTSEGPRDSENNGNRVESTSGTGTSTWYKGIFRSADSCHSVYRQVYKEWNKIESGLLEVSTY